MENGGAGHGHKVDLERGETEAGGTAGWHPGDATKTEAAVLHPGRQLGAPCVARSHIYFSFVIIARLYTNLFILGTRTIF